ncbi:glutamine amidotransferase [Pelagibius litoralis]|uniref:Glutamine amidotransferase n=1 Tax=Pelagibius litoralis TaxID=374515 RepID=A0A967EVN9_9PROT|nr:glutamine amidotransferase [Pelagibius litoralis]NIA68946.1 glutamine amidotransferase [Pelagibius litoralis]
MKQTVLLIDHPIGQRDDRASRMLQEMGYAIEWCSPGRGDVLPPLDSDFKAAIVYGGAESANHTEDKAYLRVETDWIGGWAETGRPFLGICLGGQMLARALGATVSRHDEGLHEIGYVKIDPTPASKGFLGDAMHVYQWHNEGFEVPACAELLASGPVFRNQAFRYGANAYGIQFHPEVSRPVMERWMREASHMLEEPGAQSKVAQLAAAARFDAPMEAWLRGFLTRWLA